VFYLGLSIKWKKKINYSLARTKQQKKKREKSESHLLFNVILCKKKIIWKKAIKVEISS
jgi:hypothetical protein